MRRDKITEDYYQGYFDACKTVWSKDGNMSDAYKYSDSALEQMKNIWLDLCSDLRNWELGMYRARQCWEKPENKKQQPHAAIVPEFDFVIGYIPSINGKCKECGNQVWHTPDCPVYIGKQQQC